MKEEKPELKPITARDIAELVPECRYCGANVWESLPDDQKKIVLEIANLSRRMMGKTTVLHSVCFPCEQRYEKAYRYEQMAMRFKMIRDEMQLPPNLLKFWNPWKILLDRHPQEWKVIFEWTPHRRNLLISGKHGTGKTSMARYLLCKTLIDHEGLSVAELYAPFLEDKAKRQFVNRVQHVSVLVIDDVAECNFSLYGFQLLRDILHMRADRNCCTIITSNIDASGLKAKWRFVDPENQTKVLALLDRMNPMLELKLEGKSIRPEVKYGQSVPDPDLLAGEKEDG